MESKVLERICRGRPHAGRVLPVHSASAATRSPPGQPGVGDNTMTDGSEKDGNCRIWNQPLGNHPRFSEPDAERVPADATVISRAMLSPPASRWPTGPSLERPDRGGRIGMFHFTADNLRQFGQLIVVAARHFRQGRALISTPKWVARLLQGQQQRRGLQRPDVDRSFVATDHELPSLTALDFDQTAAHGTCGLRVFEHGQRVIGQVVQVGTRAAKKRCDPFGLAHHCDRCIDHVAAEFKHRAAGELGQGTALVGGALLADYRVHLEHFAQPAFADARKQN